MYAALLRGINVGGNRKVPMAELRELLGGLGHDAVGTHLNSGNAVFRSDGSDEDTLAAELEDALEQHFGFHVACMVRGAEYLRDVRDACPFPTDGVGGKELHVVFCSRAVPAERLASLDAAAFLPEEVRARGTGRCICTRRAVSAPPASLPHCTAPRCSAVSTRRPATGTR